MLFCRPFSLLFAILQHLQYPRKRIYNTAQPRTMAAAPAITHVDVDLINTSLPDRVAYLTSFLGFGPQDLAILTEIAPIARSLVPGLVDGVYEHLFEYDVTKRVFLNRNEVRRHELVRCAERLPDHDRLAGRASLASCRPNSKTFISIRSRSSSARRALGPSVLRWRAVLTRWCDTVSR